MKLKEVLESAEDSSVNFIFTGNFPGYFEARYVRRKPDYFVCYLSSQSGCSMGCTMCHLTATGQKDNSSATIEQLLTQARTVLNWYEQNSPEAKVVHFNFMARGEALVNPFILSDNQKLFRYLAEESLESFGLFPRFLVSTIMPGSVLKQTLTDIFPVIHPEIYYSIYSVREKFRDKWLPHTIPVSEALAKLKEYQDLTRKIPKLHFCFIEGENDGEDDVVELCKTVKMSGLIIDVNIVRYNPPSPKLGQESPEDIIVRNVEIIRQWLPFAEVRVIPRVGFDVKASCGMFIPK